MRQPLKLCRAEKHFRDLQARVGPIRERHTYPVSEGFEYENQTRSWVRRVNFPDLDDPMLQILAGDLMFNARSALDHLAAALVPPKLRTPKIVKDTQFPIFSRDIDEVDPVTGKYAHPNDRANFGRMTSGFPSGAIGYVKGLQPYMFGAQKGPENHAFAILADLQNADKHRELIIVANGLSDPIIRHVRPSGLITFESGPGGLPADRILRNGAVVDRAPTNDLTDVKVEVEGTMEIVISEGGDGPHRAFPDVFDAMLRQVRKAFDRLERFVGT